jgi:hypothetical protein
MGIEADVPTSGYPTYPAPRGELGAGQSSTWFFGETLRPRRATVLLTSPSAGVQIRFGAVRADGATRWGTAVPVGAGARSAAGSLPPGTAVGLAVQVISGRLPAQQATVAVGQRTYELDGSLSDAIRPGPWRPTGSVDDYSLFVRTSGPHPVYAVRRAGRPSPPISVVSDGADAETVSLRSAFPTVVVRDVAWDAGWQASVTVDGGPAEPLRVAPRGLTQQVRLPAGTDLVTFTYRPPHWLVASSLSEGSSLLLLVLAVVALFRRGRRGRSGRVSRSGRSGRHRRNGERAPAAPAAAPPAAPPATPPARDPYVVSSRGGPA